MGALPKKKHTKGRTGRRRGPKKMSLPNLTPCPSCKKLKRPHVVCPHCGYHHAQRGKRPAKPATTQK